MDRTARLDPFAAVVLFVVAVAALAVERMTRRAGRSPSQGCRIVSHGGPPSTLRLGLRSIGEAPLTDDFDGSSASLPAYEVLDLSARTRLPGRARLELALSLTNALDERHATRGIEAVGGPYFTPAAPRAITLALGHRL